MKKGYSNVHGLIVDAAELDYRDCEAFQIVCPECREFVFKSIRRGDDGAIHYFSHYAADPEANQHCELRVAQRFADGIPAEDLVEHEQTLQHYIACFSNMLDSLPMFGSPKGRRSLHANINASKGAAGIRKYLRDGLTILVEQDFVRQTAFGDEADEGIFDRWDSEPGNYVPKTEFGRSIQARIATDTLRTLLTKPAILAWNELFSAAWTAQLAAAISFQKEDEWPDFVKHLGPVLLGAAEGKDMRREIAHLQQLPAHAPYMKYGGTWWDKLHVELMNQIVEILLQIDYSKWSRRHLANIHTPAAIAKKAREEARTRYERDMANLKAAGVDTSTKVDRAKVAEQAHNELDHEERIKSALHMMITGEGLQYRHSVDEPNGAYSMTPVVLIVRFAQAYGGDYEPTFERIRRDWALASPPISPVPETMCFQLQEKQLPFGTLARHLDSLATPAAVAEASLMLYGDDKNIMGLASTGTQRSFQMLIEQADQ